MKRTRSWIVLIFLLVTTACMVACNTYDTARSGYPTTEGGAIADCGGYRWLFDDSPSEGQGYIFGDIRSVEPILDGTRARLMGDTRDSYLNDKAFECDTFGLAAISITLENVKTTWESDLTDAVVDVTTLSLRGLSSSPIIEQGTHRLQWSAGLGEKPKFPGKGDRLGLLVVGHARGDHLAAIFSDVIEVHADGTTTRQVQNDCVRYDDEKFGTEASILKAMRANPTYASIKQDDHRWDTTSVCEQR